MRRAAVGAALRSLTPLFIALLIGACSNGQTKPDLRDAGPSTIHDAGVRDAGFRDGGPTRDAGPVDGGDRDAGDRDAGDRDAGDRDGGIDGGSGPIVVVMIGDGMGFAQIEAASYYRAGRAGALAMEQLPVQGAIRTASLSGLTDSAASATAMATGVKTRNRHIGVDESNTPLETSIELAMRLGLGTGVVSSSHLSHATPASFSAHFVDRDGFSSIAASQAVVRPDIMLGGGRTYLGPHVAVFEAAGHTLVTSAAELAALDPAATQVLGLFAAEHMPFVRNRTATSTVPSLTAMSLAAIERLEKTGRGFFLMIEGSRIDMAAHNNDAPNMIAETVDFDDAVAAVDAWATARGDVTLIVTADHECGGVTITGTGGAGVFPEVAWRWDQHTNTQVGVFARGPGTEVFDGAIRDNTWVHAVTQARLTNTPRIDPTPGLVVDGHLSDLRFSASTQVVATGFGDGINHLDALRLDADERRLAVGIEGRFEWNRNAVVVLIDVDFGAATGPADLDGALADQDARIDTIISALGLLRPMTPGFGVDAAVGVWGGTTLRDEDLIADAGFRGFTAPLGQPNNFFWTPISTNFGEGVRTVAGTSSKPDEGWEMHIPWTALFPSSSGRVPAGATIAVAAVLVNDDGGFLSNQALPPFAVSTMNPGRTPTALPGFVSFMVDQNGDGIPDDPAPPVARP